LNPSGKHLHIRDWLRRDTHIRHLPRKLTSRVTPLKAQNSGIVMSRVETHGRVGGLNTHSFLPLLLAAELTQLLLPAHNFVLIHESGVFHKAGRGDRPIFRLRLRSSSNLIIVLHIMAVQTSAGEILVHLLWRGGARLLHQREQELMLLPLLRS
jgi:hypothetical protein